MNPLSQKGVFDKIKKKKADSVVTKTEGQSMYIHLVWIALHDFTYQYLQSLQSP